MANAQAEAAVEELADMIIDGTAQIGGGQKGGGLLTWFVTALSLIAAREYEPLAAPAGPVMSYDPTTRPFVPGYPTYFDPIGPLPERGAFEPEHVPAGEIMGPGHNGKFLTRFRHVVPFGPSGKTHMHPAGPLTESQAKRQGDNHHEREQDFRAWERHQPRNRDQHLPGMGGLNGDNALPRRTMGEVFHWEGRVGGSQANNIYKQAKNLAEKAKTDPTILEQSIKDVAEIVKNVPIEEGKTKKESIQNYIKNVVAKTMAEVTAGGKRTRRNRRNRKSKKSRSNRR